MNIILASGSPRRRDLLNSAQIDFSIMSIDIDESTQVNESPTDYIQRMVANKSDAALKQLNAQLTVDDKITVFPMTTPFIILTADTIGVLPDGKTVLVKPDDREHAYLMWQKMSDNSHQVWTAVQATQVQLVCTDHSSKSLQVTLSQQIIERTDVTFIPLTIEMMTNYWDSGEPADKAGGYGIQGLAAAWVTRINGSYTNVVGLPLAQTLALLTNVHQDHHTHS